jgi:hypothetical protein
MSAEKNNLTIDEFSAMLATEPEATPEVKAFSELTKIQNPAEIGKALATAAGWGWW